MSGTLCTHRSTRAGRALNRASRTRRDFSFFFIKALSTSIYNYNQKNYSQRAEVAKATLFELAIVVHTVQNVSSLQVEHLTGQAEHSATEAS